MAEEIDKQDETDEAEIARMSPDERRFHDVTAYEHHRRVDALEDVLNMHKKRAVCICRPESLNELLCSLNGSHHGRRIRRRL